MTMNRIANFHKKKIKKNKIRKHIKRKKTTTMFQKLFGVTGKTFLNVVFCSMFFFQKHWKTKTKKTW